MPKAVIAAPLRIRWNALLQAYIKRDLQSSESPTRPAQAKPTRKKIRSLQEKSRQRQSLKRRVAQLSCGEVSRKSQFFIVHSRLLPICRFVYLCLILDWLCLSPLGRPATVADRPVAAARAAPHNDRLFLSTSNCKTAQISENRYQLGSKNLVAQFCCGCPG